MGKNKIISKAIRGEDEVIGNLKSQFTRRTLHGQRLIGISPAIANGNIALAYHRGLAEGRRERQKEVDYWRIRYNKLKEKSHGKR